jgi:transposase InsO family protein
VSCYRLIDAEKAHHHVSRLTRVLGVSRAGYYAWASRPPSQRTLTDAYLAQQVRTIHARSRGTYGAPRVHAELRLGLDIHLGSKRVARLMREHGLQGIHRRRRQPAPGLVCHSDHGCQYTSFAYGRRLAVSELVASMGTVGDALDNAVAESFFATLECELLDRYPWPTRSGLRTAIFDFIEVFYNRQRRHSTLDYHPPAVYEHQHASTAPAA